MLAYFGYYQCHCVIVFLRLHLVIEELNLFPLDPLLRIFFLGRTKTIVQKSACKRRLVDRSEKYTNV